MYSCGSFMKSKQNKGENTYLALGDSYTIGQSVSETERFPTQLVNELNKTKILFQEPKIIAKTGWTTIELIQAIKNADLQKKYDLVTLLIGVNNEFQGQSSIVFEKELKELCETAIQLAGGNKKSVILLTIPDYGFTPFGSRKQEQISRRITEFNDIVKATAVAVGIKLVDITPISKQGLKDTELIANDGLHPSEKMYSLWVNEINAALLNQD